MVKGARCAECRLTRAIDFYEIRNECIKSSRIRIRVTVSKRLRLCQMLMKA